MRLLTHPTVTFDVVANNVVIPPKWDEATILPKITTVFTPGKMKRGTFLVEGPMVIGQLYDVTLSGAGATVEFRGLQAITSKDNVYTCQAQSYKLIYT